MKLFSILFISFLAFAGHKTAKDIYESGKVENIKDFTRTDDRTDSFSSTYKYKYDTMLTVVRSYGDNRKTILCDAFYYDGKKEGTWLLHDDDGKLTGEVRYKNDKYDGIYISYYGNGNMKEKILYNEGKIVNQLDYSESGTIVGSATH